MTISGQRQHLQVQLIEAERFLKRIAAHPLMGKAYAIRAQALREALAALPEGGKEAKVVLYFSGEPVKGSHGIEAQFTGRILEPFQRMVMSDYADRHRGIVGTKSKRSGEADSRLMLTSMPRGSVGLELARMDEDDIFEDEHLADTLHHVTELVSSAASNDEDFAEAVEDVAPKVIQNLRNFLEVAAKGKAGLKLETGDYNAEISPAKIKEAFDRVASTDTKDEIITAQGTLRGVLLESLRFEFVGIDGIKLTGKVDLTVPEERIEQVTKIFLNAICFAHLRKTTITFRNGKRRTLYALLDLSDTGVISSSSNAFFSATENSSTSSTSSELLSQ